MPELPEVELVKRGLAATVVGHEVLGVAVRGGRTFSLPADTVGRLLRGRRWCGVERRGKLLIADLDHGQHLLMHLMMTGQVVVRSSAELLFAGGHPSRSMLGPMPNQTTRLTLELTGERAMYFNDARGFARMRICDDAAIAADAFLSRLGPEPLSDQFTLAGFRARLERHRRAPIKAVILDQSVVAGVGNIYADESLHLARIHPVRPAGSLTAAEVGRLRQAIMEILELAIATGGTSFADYADADRPATGYYPHARVFRRRGRPCPVCGTTIERLLVAGRGTAVCPRCQPRYRRRRGGGHAHRAVAAAGPRA